MWRLRAAPGADGQVPLMPASLVHPLLVICGAWTQGQANAIKPCLVTQPSSGRGRHTHSITRAYKQQQQGPCPRCVLSSGQLPFYPYRQGAYLRGRHSA